VDLLVIPLFLGAFSLGEIIPSGVVILLSTSMVLEVTFFGASYGHGRKFTLGYIYSLVGNLLGGIFGLGRNIISGNPFISGVNPFGGMFSPERRNTPGSAFIPREITLLELLILLEAQIWGGLRVHQGHMMLCHLPNIPFPTHHFLSWRH
jgi:hypothetical protein